MRFHVAVVSTSFAALAACGGAGTDSAQHRSMVDSSGEEREGAIEDYEAPDLLGLLTGDNQSFDFGSRTSPLALGANRVPVITYIASTGFGWSSTASIQAVSRRGTDPLLSDFHTAAVGTFLVDLPNGNYAVEVTSGDSRAAHDLLEIAAEGNVVATGVSSAIGEFAKVKFNAYAGDGQLTLRFSDRGGVTSRFALNGLSVSRLVVVGNQAPIAVNPGSQAGVVGAITTLAIQASDPQGQPLTFSASGLPAGLTIDSKSGIISGAIASTASATNTVIVTVSDGQASANVSFSWTVTPGDTPPLLTTPVKFAWDASPSLEVVGYRLFIGSVSGNYFRSIDLGKVTTFAVSDLIFGEQIFVVVSAFDGTGRASAFSNEVSHVVQ